MAVCFKWCTQVPKNLHHCCRSVSFSWVSCCPLILSVGECSFLLLQCHAEPPQLISSCHLGLRDAPWNPLWSRLLARWFWSWWSIDIHFSMKASTGLNWTSTACEGFERADFAHAQASLQEDASRHHCPHSWTYQMAGQRLFGSTISLGSFCSIQSFWRRTFLHSHQWHLWWLWSLACCWVLCLQQLSE